MPSSFTVPSVGVSSPASRLKSVVFPEPEAPIMATVSFEGMLKWISCSIVSFPVASETVLPRWRTSIAEWKKGVFDMSVTGVFRGWLSGFRLRHVFAVSLLLCLFMGNRVYSAPKTVLVLGDSLSAEYGLKRNTGWVRLLDDRLKKSYPGGRVVNASISGETTAGGRARLPALLKRYAPSIVIIELGGNDGLRGLPAGTVQENLSDMIRMVKKEKGKVLLLGMEIPPNYGSNYTRDFSRVYRTVAKKDKVTLVPFFLKNVADKADLFQADRVHPTVQAQPVLLDNVWPYLKPLLD